MEHWFKGNQWFWWGWCCSTDMNMLAAQSLKSQILLPVVFGGWHDCVSVTRLLRAWKPLLQWFHLKWAAATSGHDTGIFPRRADPSPTRPAWRATGSSCQRLWGHLCPHGQFYQKPLQLPGPSGCLSADTCLIKKACTTRCGQLRTNQLLTQETMLFSSNSSLDHR